MCSGKAVFSTCKVNNSVSTKLPLLCWSLGSHAPRIVLKPPFHNYYFGEKTFFESLYEKWTVLHLTVFHHSHLWHLYLQTSPTHRLYFTKTFVIESPFTCTCIYLPQNLPKIRIFPFLLSPVASAPRSSWPGSTPRSRCTPR